MCCPSVLVVVYGLTASVQFIFTPLYSVLNILVYVVFSSLNAAAEMPKVHENSKLGSALQMHRLIRAGYTVWPDQPSITNAHTERNN